MRIERAEGYFDDWDTMLPDSEFVAVNSQLASESEPSRLGWIRGSHRVTAAPELTAEERRAVELDELEMENIRAALSPRVNAQLAVLWQRDALRGEERAEEEVIAIPKTAKFAGLIELLKVNDYIITENEGSVDLDLTGRILAGLLIKNKELPSLVRSYLNKPYNHKTRQVVGEMIEKFKKDYGIK